MHPHGYKVSKWITVVVRPQKEGVMPEAYMASDLAQALERDRVFGYSDVRSAVTKRVLAEDEDEILPSIIQEGRDVSSFRPEFLLVDIQCGMSSKRFPIIEHS